jgi:chemosensory pili system protein ChpE
MPAELVIILTGVALGFAYCAVPGAVNTECIRRGLVGGMRPALLIQIGAIVGDLFWATLGLTGAAILRRFDAVTVLLGLIGAGFLFALARNSFLAAIRPSAASTAVAGKPGRPLLVGMAFSLANPAGLAFWSGMGSGLLATLGEPTRVQIALILAAFFVGALLWSGLVSAIVSWGRRFATPKLFRWVDAISGVALSYFGVRLLLTTTRKLGRWVFPGVRALA